MSAILEVEAVRTGYGDAQVIEAASLAIEAGRVFALLGKNGAGKTTLLRTIMGLHRIWSGAVRIAGADVTMWRTDRIAALGVSYSPQERALFPDLTVNDNLRLGGLQYRESEYRRRRDRVVAYFPFLGARMRQRAGSLSGGEQAMLKVARAILGEPRLVLLDEISEGLQPRAVDQVKACLAAECAKGSSILLIEQNLDFIWQLAHGYGLFGHGRVVDAGTVAQTGAREAIAAHLAI